MGSILNTFHWFGRSKPVSKINTLMLAFVLSFSSGLSADDTELFFSSASRPPNILFLLDNSASMNAGVPGTGGSRMDALKQALSALVTDLEGVNVGFIQFNQNVDLIATVEDVDVAANKQQLLDTVSTLEAITDPSLFGTATQDALWTGRSYLRGELANPLGGLYDSPIVHECQQNHVILMTDGRPTRRENIVSEVESVLGTTCAAATVNQPGDGDCGAEIGAHLFTSDLDAVTHTIGFDFLSDWLPSVSGNTTLEADGSYSGGFGNHFDVSSSQELLDAFKSILDGTGSTFASPVVALNSFNESRHRDELYYSQFLSSNSVRWNGNIKKYRLSEVTDTVTGLTETVIVDGNDQPLLDDAGQIRADSRSLWSASNDGGSIPEGGFAHQLPLYSDRNWYTDYNRTDPVRVDASDINGIAIDVKVPATSLGAVDNAERDTLVSWVLGRDVEGADPLTGSPTGAAQNNNYAADSLHNSPLLASYFTRSGTGERGEILFSTNNLGLLHAIDPTTGQELWSYTPEEHLDNIKAYFDNAVSSDHVYGLDGQFTLHTVPGQRSGYDFWADEVLLYMTERRGGNRIYALDVSDGLTDPTANPFSVMWKITGGVGGTLIYDKNGDGRNDFADLGQTWSRPQMVDVSINCPSNCETRELLMFAGGYNPDIYDDVNLDYDTLTVPTESHGNAIYFVDPHTGELEWSVGNGAHHSLNLPMIHSIPSTPVPVDTDFDGSIDLIFFVDVAGNVWRVDFGREATNLNDLHVAGGKIAELSPVGQSLRFFNPVDVVVSGTNFSTAFFSLVTGTGMRTSPLFVEPNQNRLYTIIDRFVHEVPFRFDSSGNRNFDYRYVTDSTGNHSVITADDDVLRNVSDPSSTTSTNFGFFRTFQLGEKILQPTLVTNNLIFANSYVPPANMGGANCNFDIGETRLYISSLLDGGNTVPGTFGGDYLTVGAGILSSGQIIDTGKGEAPFFLVDNNVFTLKDLTAPNNNEVFRRFRRTGWVELDEY